MATCEMAKSALAIMATATWFFPRAVMARRQLESLVVRVVLILSKAVWDSRL